MYVHVVLHPGHINYAININNRQRKKISLTQLCEMVECQLQLEKLIGYKNKCINDQMMEKYMTENTDFDTVLSIVYDNIGTFTTYTFFGL